MMGSAKVILFHLLIVTISFAQPGYFNVREAPFSALGDGLADDTKAIQSALDAAEKNGGGVVVVPPGRYLVGTLRLPNRVYLKGLGGTTFGPKKTEITRGPKVFMAHLGTVLQLKAGETGHLIVPKGSPNLYTFFQGGVEDLALFGNRKTGEARNDGIHIPDAIGADGNGDPNRSQALLRNLLIYYFSGNGFYGGKYQHELFIDNVWTYGCGGNGFEFHGEDLKVHNSGAGDNGGAGFLITGSGTGRYFDIDAWGNENGIELSDVLSLSFFRLQSGRNRKHGLWIHAGTTPTSFSPGRIQVYQGTFDGNSTSEHGRFSEVMLDSPGYGPYGILLHGCEFRGSSKDPKPSYALSNNSRTPRENLVESSLFIEQGYALGITGNPEAFELRNCTSYENGGAIFGQMTLPVVDIQHQDYSLKLSDGFVRVKTGSTDRSVFLPDSRTIQVGTVYYISKSDDTPTLVNLKAQSDDRLEGVTLVSKQFGSIMVIRTQTGWYATSSSP